MRRPTPDQLAALGTEYDGVISTEALARAGFDPALGPKEVAAGRWQRLVPGLYLANRAAPRTRQRMHAAMLHAGPLGIITGRAGLVLRGVKGVELRSGQVTVVVPHQVKRVSSGFVTLIRTRHLPGCQVLQRQGHADLPVARVEQCVIDAIRSEPDLARTRALACAAVRDREVDWAEVARRAVRRGPGGHHVRQVVRDIADGVRSPAEGDLNDVLLPASRRGRLPAYLLNPDVLLDGVLLGSPDAWFVGLGLGDEQDSREWHGSEDGLDATLARHERFRKAGLLLNHATPARLRSDPAAHVATLGALVVERRALAVPEPPGLVVLGRGPLLPARSDWPQVETSRWR